MANPDINPGSREPRNDKFPYLQVPGKSSPMREVALAINGIYSAYDLIIMRSQFSGEQDQISSLEDIAKLANCGLFFKRRLNAALGAYDRSDSKRAPYKTMREINMRMTGERWELPLIGEQVDDLEIFAHGTETRRTMEGIHHTLLNIVTPSRAVVELMKEEPEYKPKKSLDVYIDQCASLMTGTARAFNNYFPQERITVAEAWQTIEEALHFMGISAAEPLHPEDPINKAAFLWNSNNMKYAVIEAASNVVKKGEEIVDISFKQLTDSVGIHMFDPGMPFDKKTLDGFVIGQSGFEKIGIGGTGQGIAFHAAITERKFKGRIRPHNPKGGGAMVIFELPAA